MHDAFDAILLGHFQWVCQTSWTSPLRKSSPSFGLLVHLQEVPHLGYIFLSELSHADPSDSSSTVPPLLSIYQLLPMLWHWLALSIVAIWMVQHSIETEYSQHKLST